MFLSLNDNVLHVDNMNKKKREDVNVTYLWYYRLDHINKSKINKLYKDNFFDSYDYESYGTCESCLMRKMTKTLFSRYEERVSDILDLVHTDVYGPISTQARDGYSYCCPAMQPKRGGELGFLKILSLTNYL